MAKERKLCELKTELAAVEWKIQLSIAPEPKDKLEVQVEKQKQSPTVSESIVRIKDHLH